MQAEAANATFDRTQILGALQRAAQATGADFDYLLNTATRESGLKPGAQAGTSSAVGLFQFIEQSWLGTVKTYGAKHGLGALADAITRGSDGRYHTSNPSDRAAILALRKDPTVAALMAGEFSQATRATLQSELGRDVCGGELYAAHFLGPDAACRLIKMSENQPTADAATAFPGAASANRNVFFHRDGTAKTVREVYDWTLRQPNGAAALNAMPVKPAADPKPVQYVDNAGSESVDTQNLLLSFAQWQPRHGFFSSEIQNDGAVPTSSIVMSPAMMDVLQSVNTIPGSDTAH
ncbi:MAG: hypothetical protein JO167_08750 [Alphaproteobacteria bacterium]|nr:hypothetical protein [Alphaproteobacteria bacterium]